ncbi:MAG: hypothetical protein HC770_11485 [Pseudanabaena sp. CRU_2_10]|nr:hypothetical protein [Pseudanabaena sp. CRU_2_10]
MSKEKSPVPTTVFPPTQHVIFGSIIWAMLALLYYLFLGLPIDNSDGTFVRPYWYRIGIYIFQTLPIATTGFFVLA